MDLVNGLNGEKIKSEPKIIGQTQVLLVLNHFDNGSVAPDIETEEGLSHFELLGILDHFHSMVKARYIK